MRLARHSLVLLVSVFAVACGRNEPSVSSTRDAVISDAVHTSGTPGFYFLFPMVPPPRYTGTFRAGLQPVVSIEELSPGTRGTIATYTTSGGPHGGRVFELGESYNVLWPTAPFALNPAYNAYGGGDPVNFIDPTGLDVWIEGPSGSEPGGHQSINVGDPNGAYESWSFAINGFGAVYLDEQHGGPIGLYLKSDPDQDRMALQLIYSQTGADNRKFYGPNTCRTYSQDKFWAMSNALGIQPSTPPSRQPAPLVWWRQMTNPFTSTSSTSTTTSSSGSGASR